MLRDVLIVLFISMKSAFYARGLLFYLFYNKIETEILHAINSEEDEEEHT